MVCYRAGDETVGLDMEERGRVKISSLPSCFTNLLASLAGMAQGPQGLPAGLGAGLTG